MHQETLKRHRFLDIIPPGHHDAVTSSRLRLNRYSIFFSGNVFKFTLFGVSGPKNDILCKPEVSHKKVKIDVFALDIDFKLGLLVHITPLTDFASKKIQNQTGSAPINSKKHIDFFKKNPTLVAMMPLSPHDYV